MRLTERKRAITRTSWVALIIFILVVAAAGAYVAIAPTPQRTTSASRSATSTNQPVSSTVITSSGGKPVNVIWGCTGCSAGLFTGVMYYAAQELGTWKKLGLNVTAVYFPGGSGTLISAMASGSIVVGELDALHIVEGIGTGLKIKVFSPEMVCQCYSIAVPANSNITSLSQIKGKKLSISVGNVGAGSWLFGKLMMQAAGLKDGTDYTLASFGTSPASVAGFEQGKTEAISFPTVALLAAVGTGKMTPIRILANSSTLLPHPWLDLGFVATTDYIQQHPDTLKSLVQGFDDAYNYFAGNKTWAIGFLQKHFQVDKATAEAMYPIALAGYTTQTRVDPIALQNAQSLFIKAGVVQNTTALSPVSEWYTNLP